jgi:hypothetical protein
MSIVRWRLVVFGVFPLLGACGGGSGGDAEGSANAGASYTKTCTRTVCQSCKEDVDAACSECEDLCASPYADISCFSTCRSICGTRCASCSGSDSCLEWQVELPEPALDQALYDKCLAAENTCSPDDYDGSFCNYIARTEPPSRIKDIECRLSNACAVSACRGLPFSGTLGTEYCARAEQCGQPCQESQPSFLNSVERVLRPELARSLRQCIAEDTCSVFKACAAAHDALWQLAWEKADPGTKSACGEEWLDECGTCECGFTCVQSCSTCAPRCVDPCESDADCVGKTVGSLAAPHCDGIYAAGEKGYCSPIFD